MTKFSVLQQYLVFDFFNPEILSFFFVNWWTLNLQKIYQIKSVTKQCSKFTLRKLRRCPFFACAWVRDIPKMFSFELVTNWKRQSYMKFRCAFFTEVIRNDFSLPIDKYRFRSRTKLWATQNAFNENDMAPHFIPHSHYMQPKNIFIHIQLKQLVQNTWLN